jgi:hypothetical protein
MIKHGTHPTRAISPPTGAAQQMDPGTQNGWYDINNSTGGLIGTLVEMAGSNVTQGGYTWTANQAFWFWQGNTFPSAFRLVLHAYDTLPASDPSHANPITTTGPFSTTTCAPGVGGYWWTIQKYSGGSLSSIGWLNIQPGNTQYWYQTAAGAYLTLGEGEALVFTGTQSAPTAAMYRAIATPV